VTSAGPLQPEFPHRGSGRGDHRVAGGQIGTVIAVSADRRSECLKLSAGGQLSSLVGADDLLDLLSEQATGAIVGTGVAVGRVAVGVPGRKAARLSVDQPVDVDLAGIAACREFSA